MEEVAFVECQLLSIAGLRLVVVESLDDLLGREGLDGLGGDGQVGRVFIVLFALERSADGLEATCH